MRMLLSIIELQPLYSPPFVKVCFTPKHILDLMGPWTSHLVANQMLGLQQKLLLGYFWLLKLISPYVIISNSKLL
jgi:hypothetical protein